MSASTKRERPLGQHGDFLMNKKSGCWNEFANSKTTTTCGWAYADAPHEQADRCRAAVWYQVCDRCMPLRRRALYRTLSKSRDAEPESADE